MTVKFKRLGDFVEALAFRVTKAPPASPAADTVYKQVFASCLAVTTTTQSVSSADTTITLDTFRTNIGGWTISSNAVVVPLKMYAMIYGAVCYETADSVEHQIRIYVNGSAPTEGWIRNEEIGTGSANHIVTAFRGPIELAAGDAITLVSNHLSGGNLNVGPGAGGETWLGVMPFMTAP